MITQWTRVLAWLYVGALVYVAIAPPDVRPQTPLPHFLEHLGAFGISGLLFSIGYRSRPTLVMLAGTGLAVALECAQLLVTGRHARWLDLAMDVLGFWAGVSIGLAACRSRNIKGRVSSQDQRK
jgi:VanZ family protein